MTLDLVNNKNHWMNYTRVPCGVRIETTSVYAQSLKLALMDSTKCPRRAISTLSGKCRNIVHGYARNGVIIGTIPCVLCTLWNRPLFCKSWFDGGLRKQWTVRFLSWGGRGRGFESRRPDFYSSLYGADRFLSFPIR